MNGPFQVAQAGGTATSSTSGTPVRIYKLTKPLTDQAVVVNVGYDQKVKVDFSAIANEKITLVHVGEKLIILFDNESTVTVEPFFKSRADGPGNDTRDEITVEMAPGRDISVKEFATLFPITTDASVLPAADQGGNSNGNAQASGAYFSPFSVDPLDPVTLNKLAPQEELGNFVLEIPTGGNVIPDQAGDNLRPDELPPSALADRPTILVGPGQRLIVDESFIPLVGSQTLVAGTPNSNRDLQDFASSFTIDAPAGVQSVTFGLTINNPTTNLIDVATGQSVRLVSNGSGEVDGVITINATQITVFTLTVDGAGHVEFTVLLAGRQFVHSADVLEGISPNAGLISLIATVTDNNGATASASLDLGSLITVFDDVPRIAAVNAGSAMSVDESFLTAATNGIDGSTPNAANTVKTGDFSSAFVHLNGADGATIAYSLGVSSPNVDSGLIDSATGQHVLLVLNGNTIEGHVGASSTLAFTLALDSSTGVVTLTDLRAVHEDIPGNFNESKTLAAGLVTLTATITDGDGDFAAASVDLGKQISFLDDGPSISLRVLGEEQRLPSLNVDESFLSAATNGGVDGSTPNPGLGHTVDTENFASAFTAVTGPDGGAKTYAVSIAGNGTPTNLTDSGTGLGVVLDQAGSTVAGYVTGYEGDAAFLVFTIEVNTTTGDVTLTQLRAVHEDVPGDFNEGKSLAAGLVTLTATVTDKDLDTASAQIDLGQQVRFHDDGPSAVNDGPYGVVEDGASVVSGNVLSNDVSGADGPKGFVSWGGAGDAASIAALNSYGTLVQNGDGTWTYTLDNGRAATQGLTAASNLTYTLHYIMTDADGDQSPATLTITIQGATDTASVVTTQAQGPDATVYEAGLNPNGSNAALATETTGGSFTISATDGIQDIVIGGVTFTLAAIQAFGTTNGVVNTGEGMLTLTGYTGTSSGGTVNFSYTLSATIDNDSKVTTGNDTVDLIGFNDSVALTVHGIGGSTASDNLVIHVVDDAPAAANDGPAAVVEDSVSLVSGNVLSNDVSGADTPKSFVAWDAAGDGAAIAALSSYGTLVQGNDGSWSYTLENGRAATQALTASSNLSYTLHYTMTDADGDQSPATLTITIQGATDTASVVTTQATGADATVYEAGLNPDGSNAAADTETTGGSFTISATDGIQDIVIGGATFTLAEIQAFGTTNGVVNTGEGMLTLTGYTGTSSGGTVNFSYTLSATIDNDSKVTTGNDTVDLTGFNDSVALTVHGIGGTTASDNLVIHVVDDAPAANADADSVSSAVQTLNFDDVVLGDNAETPIGSYLGFNFIQTGVYNPPGSGPFATYAPHSGSNLAFIGEKNGVEQPGYTGTPGDPITIAHTGGSRFTALGAWFSSNGSEPMTITVFGYVNGDLVGSFTQEIHQGGAGGPTYVNLSGLGSVDEITLDAPNYFGFDDFSYVDNSTATGNVITGADTTNNGVDVLGADGAKIAGVVGVTSDAISDGSHNFQVAGQYGTLVINESGDYTYTRFDGSPIVANDAFTYTLTDGDGDFSTATLTIHIDDSGVTTTVPVAGAAGALVSEAGLPARTGEPAGSNEPSNSETTTGSISYTAADGPPVVTIDGTAVTFVGQAFVHAGVGTLTITSIAAGSIGYSYTLADNTSGDTTSDSFAVVVTDKDGDHNDKTLTISIVDDAPTATVDTNFVNEGALLTVVAAGGVLSNDVAGADGFAAGGGVVGVRAAGIDTTTAVATGVATSIIGLHGTLVLQANGGYTYQSTSNTIGSNATDVFVYTIKDGDGDLSTTTLTINLADVTIVAPADSDVTVNESALDTTIAGSDLAAGTITGSLGTNSALETDATNQLNATGGFGGLTYALVSGGNAATAGTYGTIKVNADGTYVYTLTKPFDTSPDANNGANTVVAESFQYNVTDANGNTATGTITVNVVDDAPSAAAGLDLTVLETASATVGTNLLLNDVRGADGATLTAVDLGSGFQAIAASGTTTITNANGTYTFQADGTWTFDPVVNASNSNTTGNFTYRITDGDGDTSTAIQVVNITNANTLPTAGDQSIIIDEEGLPNGVAGGDPGDVAGQVISQPGTLTFNFNGDGPNGTDPINFSPLDNGSHNTAVVTSGAVAVKSGGLALKYFWDASGDTLYASTDASSLANAQSTAAFKVVLNTSTGAYTYTQLKPIDHPLHDNQGTGGTPETAYEDNITIALQYQVKDSNNDSATGTLNVTINDDVPQVKAIEKTVTEGSSDTNIMLILDRSGSMGFASGVASYATRLDLLKAAAKELLDQYDAAGDIKVQIIQFNDNAQKQGSTWLSIGAAKTYIDGLSASDGTDYDDATALAPDAFDDAGKLTAPGVRNVAYFISDGEPDPTSEQVSGSELTDWINFVNANDIVSHAIGLGPSAPNTYLDPIAYDGRGTGSGTDTNALIVTDLNQLQTTLVGTVNPSISGSLIDGSIPTSFGADGGYVKSIAIGGTTYLYSLGTDQVTPSGGSGSAQTFDQATNKLTITFTGSPGESFVIDLDDGTYVYTPPTNIVTDFSRPFTYTLTDNDGDTATSTLTINVDNVNSAPVITSNGGAATAAISVAENGTAVTTVVAADADLTTPTYSLVGGADQAKFTINATTGALSFVSAPNFEAPTDAGSNNTYEVIVRASDGALTDDQTITVTVTNANEFAPVISSNGGAATAAISMAENIAPVTTVTATDADLTTPTYSLVGGADQAKFAINATTGALSFISAPNFEAPTDAGSNNTYEVIVRASDGTLTDDQTITVTVTNANDAPVGITDRLFINGPSGVDVALQNSWLTKNDTDLEGGSLNVSSAAAGTNTSGVAVTATTTTITYDGNSNSTGIFTYTANDSLVNSSSTTVNVMRGNSNSTITGGALDDILMETRGDDGVTLNGGGGNDFIVGGSGDDIIVGEQNDFLLSGGGGADTLRVGANFTSTGDGQITGIENVTLTATATLNLSNQTEGFIITGSSGADSITAGSGNDTIVGAQNDTLLAGGSGTDTLRVGANFDDTDDAQITGIENVTLTAPATLNLGQQTEGFTITGSSAADTITGGSGGDTIIGGTGADTMTGGSGAGTVDTFVIASGDTTLTIGGSGNGGTISGYDRITDFNVGVDKLTLAGAAFAAGNTTSTNGANSDLTISGNEVSSHRISNGIITFDDTKPFATALTLDSTQDVAAVVEYLRNNDLGNAGVTVAFTATIGGVSHTYIYQQAGDSQSDTNDILVDLENVTLTNGGTSLATLIGNGHIDPIVLDLGDQGIAFSSVGDGVQFDINHDGAKDQIAWTATGGDGILALDIDGSGKIESGNELFTPTFNGGHLADGIAALASLDGNHDGVINSQDQAFGDLAVWQDANLNGVSEAGELTKLGDLGISSISLTTTSGGAPIDGQHIAGTGSFTYADGTTGTFVEVDLDASLGVPPAQPDNHPADAHDLSAFAAVAAEIDHGGNIDLSALHQGGADHAPAPLGQGGEAAHPGLDAGATTPAAIAIMHEQAALAMQLAAY